MSLLTPPHWQWPFRVITSSISRLWQDEPSSHSNWSASDSCSSRPSTYIPLFPTLGSPVYPEDGGNTFLRNARIHLLDYTASRPESRNPEDKADGWVRPKANQKWHWVERCPFEHSTSWTSSRRTGNRFECRTETRGNCNTHRMFLCSVAAHVTVCRPLTYTPTRRVDAWYHLLPSGTTYCHYTLYNTGHELKKKAV
jgi:hypothetical protein